MKADGKYKNPHNCEDLLPSARTECRILTTARIYHEDTHR